MFLSYAPWLIHDARHQSTRPDMHMDVHPPASGNNVNAVSSSPADAPNGMAVDEDDSGSLRELHNDLESSIARHQASPSKQAGTASQGSFTRSHTQFLAALDLNTYVICRRFPFLFAIFGTGATPSSQNLDVWVSKWVDYSEKYGLGYLLSSGACGVYFNDSSRIVLFPDSSYVRRQIARSYLMSSFQR
jgi:hypothetical protein